MSKNSLANIGFAFWWWSAFYIVLWCGSAAILYFGSSGISLSPLTLGWHLATAIAGLALMSREPESGWKLWQFRRNSKVAFGKGSFLIGLGIGFVGFGIAIWVDSNIFSPWVAVPLVSGTILVVVGIWMQASANEKGTTENSLN